MNAEQLISLPALAKELNLPKSWLKSEADAGRLPHLKVGKRYRFNHAVIIRILAERAGRHEKECEDEK